VQSFSLFILKIGRHIIEILLPWLRLVYLDDKVLDKAKACCATTPIDKMALTIFNDAALDLAWRSLPLSYVAGFHPVNQMHPH
jgi:hypothetical protein